MTNKTKKSNRVICFTRVSTKMQDLNSQEREVIAMAKNDGYNDNQIILISEKESGYCLNEDERIGINQMKRAIEEETIDCVYCWEVSRIARRLKIVVSISDYLKERKVNLKVKKEHLEMFGCDGKENPLYTMLMAILGSFAEMERNTIIERMNRTKKMMTHNGQMANNSPKFGYSIDENKYFIVNDEEADIVRQIFTLYASGEYSCSTLAKEMNERGYTFKKTKYNKDGKFTRNSIADILASKAYSGEVRSKGNMPLGKTETEGNIYPMIVPMELIAKCEEISKSKNKKFQCKKANKYDAYCKGLLKDGNDPISRNHNQQFDGFRTLVVRSGIASYVNGNVNGNKRISISMNFGDYIVWHAVKQFRLCHNTDNGKVATLTEEMNVMVSKLFVINADLDKALKRKEMLDNGFYVEGKIKQDSYNAMTKQIDNIIAETEKKKKIVETDISSQKKLIKDSMNESSISMEDLDAFSEDKKIDLIHSTVKEVICRKDYTKGAKSNIATMQIYFVDGSVADGWYNSKSEKVLYNGIDISDGYKPKIERKKY